MVRSVVNQQTFAVLRSVMRQFASENASDAPALVPRTGAGAADTAQLNGKSGSPGSLGHLSTQQARDLAGRLNNEFQATDAFVPAGMQTLVDHWLALEKRYGWNADDQEIVAGLASSRSAAPLKLFDILAGKVHFKTPPPNDAQMRKTLALQIMTHGSKNLSRTVSYAVPYTRVGVGKNSPAEVNQLATRNFERAASLVVEQAATLPLTFETATQINYMLTRDVLPTGAGKLFHGAPCEIYTWLASKEAKKLMKSDPVAVAERVHYAISEADQFTDGNGRTARLLADLVLLKTGHAPAYYTDISNYFLRGSVRSDISRESKANYFRHIAARGEAMINRARKASDAMSH